MNNFDDETNNEFNTNCLALTLRKDYRSTIISNFFFATQRISLKVLVNVGILNFLTIIF